MCSDKAKVIEMVKQNGWALRGASEELRADKEVVLAAVSQNGRALQYASAELRADRDVVLEAVKQNWIALGYAADKLRGDDEIMIAAVKQDGTALQYYNKETLDNPYRKWLHQNFPGLEYVNEQDCFDALYYACYVNNHSEISPAEHLRFVQLFKIKELSDFSGEETVSGKEESLTEAGSAAEELPEENSELWKDREFVLKTVKNQGAALKYAKDFQKDDEVSLAAVRSYGCALKYANCRMESDFLDKELVLEAVRKDGLALEFAPDRLKADRQVVLEAIRQNARAVKFMNERFRSDKVVAVEAIKHGLPRYEFELGRNDLFNTMKLHNDPDILKAFSEQV
ncbi:MAG: DUF4116 domain-containing protein [Lachnospiraceae bacterium]|nr:DUF4116 domain-containing protein [Lachnospiraceae bacterium]